MRIFDEFVACGFPFRYCSFEKSVIRLVSFKVVVNSGGGVSVLSDITFFASVMLVSSEILCMFGGRIVDCSSL